MYKYFYHYREKPDKKTQQLFNEGHSIEQAARDLLFGHGMNVAPANPKQWNQSISITKKLIANNEPVIYEAAFEHQGVMCAVDVVSNEQGKLTCYEIKRGSHVKEVYLLDAALQYWVLKYNNSPITDFCLILFDGDRTSDSFHKDDFKIVSVLEQIQAMQTFVKKGIQAAYETLQQNEIPSIEMGKHCHEPYDCDFIRYCTKQQQSIQN